MKINNLIQVLSNKLNQNLKIVYLLIEDKTFLHESHKTHTQGKFHIKITIQCNELSKIKSIEANRKIFSILKKEINLYIHSLQIQLI